MDKAPSKKAKLFCVILVMIASSAIFLAGIWQMNIYEGFRKCTAEVTGTVVYEGTGRIRDTDKAENKYAYGEYWRQIEVMTDGKFDLNDIYAKRGKEKVGDNVIIHYDPNDPDNYYIGDGADYHKTTAVFAFVASAILPLLLIFIMIKSGRYYKAQAQNAKKYIYFDTRYCRFLFVDSGNTGFEGEVEWEYNVTGEKTCTVFFETDTAAAASDMEYYGLIEKRFLGREKETTFDINELIHEIPELRAIQPGKCYDELDKILSDKTRRDHEIRKMLADHFLFRQELIEENSTEQSIMDSIELSYIGVSRNGDTEFGIFDSDIYVDDLRVIIKADGSKEIHYKTDEQRGTDDECCDVL